MTGIDTAFQLERLAVNMKTRMDDLDKFGATKADISMSRTDYTGLIDLLKKTADFVTAADVMRADVKNLMAENTALRAACDPRKIRFPIK